MKPFLKATSFTVAKSVSYGISLIIAFAAFGAEGTAARFAERIRYVQPDGTLIELRGEGNEYRAVYETIDGYTVIFVPESKAYYYANLSAAKDELVSTGVEAGKS